jgi:hypothetical protein
MNQPPGELQKLLQHIDQLIEQAADDTTRAELERLKARLDTPEMLDMARELAGRQRAKPEELVLEFHDPRLPPVLTAAGCVISAAVCLFAVVGGFRSGTAYVGETAVSLWLVAALAGALSVMFSALSFTRTFSVRVDTLGMASRTAGNRWRQLRVGAMVWKDIRALRERDDRILEVRAADAHLFEIPMRVVNYGILKQHLENMVRLYGDRPQA